MAPVISEDMFVLAEAGTEVYVLEGGRYRRRVVVNTRNLLFPWLELPWVSHLADPERPDVPGKVWMRKSVPLGQIS